MQTNPFAAEIADRIVPEYRNGPRSYCCTGHTAKRWNAAYLAAEAAQIECQQDEQEQGK